jgi:hypothetical protein
MRLTQNMMVGAVTLANVNRMSADTDNLLRLQHDNIHVVTPLTQEHDGGCGDLGEVVRWRHAAAILSLVAALTEGLGLEPMPGSSSRVRHKLQGDWSLSLSQHVQQPAATAS